MNLNEQQKEAVNHINGPLLILAGAGSGKTRVLTERIANLIENFNVAPYNILSVTFTNKAAKEMKLRVAKKIGEDIVKAVWTGTFHSVCSRILRSEMQFLNRNSNFVIYDSSDQTKIISESLKKLNIDDNNFPASKVLQQISKAKSNGYDPEKFTQVNLDYHSQKIGEIYAMYQAELKKNNALDFDDIIFYVVKIFKEQPEVLQKYQKKFRYIMVDEYQDTNQIQYELIRALSDNYRNICVVGDVDQSIYSFRNADFRIILNFQQDYKDAKIIKLEKNYRSTKNIVSLSNEIIKANRERFPKKLDTDNEVGDKIRIFESYDDEEEARFIIKEMYRLIAIGHDYGDFSVLYRTNAQSRILEEYFVRNNIPHQVIGGFRFFERKEIKDIMAYLKVVFNPNDSIAIQRVINYPKRNIGSATIEKLVTIANDYNISLWDVFNFKTLDNISAEKQKSIKQFVALINDLIEKINHFSVSKLIKAIIDEANFIAEIQKEDEKSEKDNDRVENIYQLISSANDFEVNSDDISLEAYLNYISLLSDADSIEDTKRVKLMTVHTSKGLEFPIVFVAGVSEGIFPHAHSVNSTSALEEERRLMYVAITRAEKVLYLTFPRKRYVFGSIQSYLPSRFLAECPPELTYGYSVSKEKQQKFTDDSNYFQKSKTERKNYEPQVDYDYQPREKTPKKLDNIAIQKKLEDRYSSTPKTTSSNSGEYREGQIVSTEKWGQGKITKVMKNNQKVILVISFDSVGGSKIIDPKITKISVIR